MIEIVGFLITCFIMTGCGGSENAQLNPVFNVPIGGDLDATSSFGASGGTGANFVGDLDGPISNSNQSAGGGGGVIDAVTGVGGSVIDAVTPTDGEEVVVTDGWAQVTKTYDEYVILSGGAPDGADALHEDGRLWMIPTINQLMGAGPAGGNFATVSDTLTLADGSQVDFGAPEDVSQIYFGDYTQRFGLLDYRRTDKLNIITTRGDLLYYNTNNGGDDVDPMQWKILRGGKYTDPGFPSAPEVGSDEEPVLSFPGYWLQHPSELSVESFGKGLAPGCVAETCSTPLPMSGIAKTFGAITTLAVATKILTGCKKNKLDKTLEPPKILSEIPLEGYLATDLQSPDTLKVTVTSRTAAYATAQSDYDADPSAVNQAAVTAAAKALRKAKEELNYSRLLFCQEH